MRERLPYRWVVAAIFVAAMFMSILDATIVTVALPSIADDFGVTATQIEWVVTGYLLSLALWMPASGWIGDRFGTKRTFLVALGVFVGASLLCGLAPSSGLLVAARVLQGAGGGMLVPVGTAMLFRAFPPVERARVARVLLIPTVVAPASGPLLGGFIVDHFSWRWVFLVNLPVGIVAFTFAWWFLREHREPAAGRFDLLGFLLSGSGFAIVLYAISIAPTEGWGSPLVVGSGILGVALLTLMVRVELRQPEPLLNLRLFSDRLFRSTNLAGFFASGAFVGTLFTIPIFLQVGAGLSAFESGSVSFMEALGVVASSQIAGRLYHRLGPRGLIIGGLCITASTMIAMVFTDYDTSLWLFRIILFVLGFGQGFIFVSLQAATFATIAPADMGRASALYNAQRQSGPAVSVAVIATVIATVAGHTAGEGAELTGFHAAFITAAVFALIGIAFATRIRNRDAAATMHRTPKTVETVEPEGLTPA